MKPGTEQIYFYTAGAQLAESTLDRCAREQILSVIVAAPGRGKTEAVKHWSRANAGRIRHLRVVCTIRNSPLALLDVICRGLSLDGLCNARTDRKCFAIAKRLAEDPVMILLDEAEMLSLNCLEKLRGIWDEVSELRGMGGDRAFPLALCGTTRLRDMMLRDDLERLHRRVGEFEELPALSLDESRTILAKKWASVRIDDEAAAEIHRLSRGSFGWMNVLMRNASELASKNGKVVNHGILKAAESYLVGLEPAHFATRRA